MSTPSETINTAAQKRKRKATNDKAFLHDAHAHSDLKMIRFRQRTGWDGYGIFWMLIEHMRLQPDLSLKWEDLETLSQGYGFEPERLERLVKVAAEIGLFVVYEEGFYSESLIRRVEAYEGVSQVRSIAGQKGGLTTQSKKRQENFASKESESKKNTLLEANENFASSKCNITQYNIKKDNIIQSNGSKPNEPPPIAPRPNQPEPPEHLVDFWEEAVSALVDDNHPELFESGIFSTTGRKPMKKYPELWISAIELAEVFKLYADSGIPLEKFSLAFKPVVARLKTHKANGTRTDKIPAVNWLTSWALDQALTTLKKAKDLERSEKYLEQAQR